MNSSSFTTDAIRKLTAQTKNINVIYILARFDELLNMCIKFIIWLVKAKIDAFQSRRLTDK